MELSRPRPKGKKILPNPDEVVEIEKPGSTTSVRSNPKLFSSEPADHQDAELPIPSSMPLSVTGTSSPRPITATSQRSSSRPGTATSQRPMSPSSILPFKTTKIYPSETESPENQGSTISVKTTTREAWAGIDPKATSMEIVPRVRDSPDNKSVKSSMSEMIALPKMKGEEQAYIPYLFARDTIARIVNDMHRMKNNHVHVIHQIEDNYKTIEDETQRQFNAFVLNLRNVYKGRVSIFEQIITLHRKDIERKQIHWDDNLQSLSERNRKLLTDKRDLLVKNKLLMEKLGTVQAEAQQSVMVEVDTLNARLEQMKVEHEEGLKLQLAETKSAMDALENEKAVVADLRAQIERLQSAAPAPAVIISSQEQQAAPSWPPVVSTQQTQAEERAVVHTVAVGLALPTENVVAAAANEITARRQVTSGSQPQQLVAEMPSAMLEPQTLALLNQLETQKQELESRRRQMAEDMANLADQRSQMVKEREEMVADKKTLNELQNQQQLQINELRKEVAKWQAMYEASGTQLTQLGSIRSDYDNLLVAYNALVIAAADVDKEKAAEKISKANEQKISLESDVKELQAEITKWETEFHTKNSKAPADTDVPDSIREFQTMIAETNDAIRKLDVQVGTIEMLQRGEAPAAPKPTTPTQSASLISQPIVKVVEVVVPDPTIVAQLEECEAKCSKLQKESLNLQTKLSSLQNEAVDLRNQIAEAENKLKKAAAENSENQKTIARLTAKPRDLITTEPSSAAVVELEVAVAGEKAEVDPTSASFEPQDAQEHVLQLQARVELLEQQLEEAQQGEPSMAGLQMDTERVSGLEAEVDALEEKLRKEQRDHNDTREELEAVRVKVTSLEEELRLAFTKGEEASMANVRSLSVQLEKKEKELTEAKARVGELETKLVANLPPDAGQEVKKLLKKIQNLVKENDSSLKKAAELDGKNVELEAAKNSLQKQLDKEKQGHETTLAGLEAKLKAAKDEKEKDISKMALDWDKKEKARVAENKAKTEALQKKIKELESRPAAAPGVEKPAKAGVAVDAKSEKQIKALTDQLQERKKEIKDLQAKVVQLQEEVKKAKSEAGGDINEKKRTEKLLKELDKKLEMETKKAERDGARVKQLEEELAALLKEKNTADGEIKKLKSELDVLGVTAAQALELGEKVKTLETEVKSLTKEAQRLTEAYNTERVQRKKYFNMVEDMKGKIRVYCRARPMSKSELERGNVSVIQSPDEYSINVESSRGLKEFNFDKIFMPENSQDQVFEDTYHLVQSAFDGYNVCIFAYGQTGSGKTFTMIGDRELKFPGIAPRAFKRIFELMDENKDKFTYKISSYMMELYNDKLMDLYAGDSALPDDKMEIKKDNAGLVFVKGALIKFASTEKELYAMFEEGSKNRHTASTKMNAESSRSHLIISVIIEATNKTNGQVSKGKLSLVDLAGSERVGKTGATAETLKEANSINKSLAALGDVISALSSEQSFIPYRNNKLTMLMQDSLGGNAKTLMFVNISPADYNSDETVTSLTYAARVKLITNDAQKNSDSKKIAELKQIIQKLKAGESVDLDDTAV